MGGPIRQAAVKVALHFHAAVVARSGMTTQGRLPSTLTVQIRDVTGRPPLRSIHAL